VSPRQRRAPRRRIIGANWEAQQPRRGRPPAEVPRKATRVYLTGRQREHWLTLTEALAPLGAARIDIADLIINHLEQELNDIQRGLTGSGQVLPVGVVDLKSLYFLLDLRPTIGETRQYTITMLTKTRETMSVITVRLQSVFATTWSQVFGLGIELLFEQLANQRGQLAVVEQMEDLNDLWDYVLQPQQLQFEIQ
jgi:hypothetical protein